MPHLPIRQIVLHCTASHTRVRIAEVRRWHVEDRGWSDVGYHHLVSSGGRHEIGRPETVPGAHVKGHNTGTIGICFSGNPVAGIYPDAEQRAVLIEVVAACCGRHGLTSRDVVGHFELDPAGKPDCPGLSMNNVRLEVAHALGEPT